MGERGHIEMSRNFMVLKHSLVPMRARIFAKRKICINLREGYQAKKLQSNRNIGTFSIYLTTLDRCNCNDRDSFDKIGWIVQRLLSIASSIGD